MNHHLQRDGVRPEETYGKLVDVLKYLKSVGVEIATIL